MGGWGVILAGEREKHAPPPPPQKEKKFECNLAEFLLIIQVSLRVLCCCHMCASSVDGEHR